MAWLNTFGPDGDVSTHTTGADRYFTWDPQGNVSAELNASGNVSSPNMFDAFGLRDTGTPWPGQFSYAGQWGAYTDTSTGLILMGHRYYDPGTGRFLTRDPIGYAGGSNLYAYTGNNPVNEIDPDGTTPNAQYCNMLKEKIENLMNTLEDKMNKYDPSTDWKGGFATGYGGVTQPYYHYFEIFRLQAQISSLIWEYNQNCGNKSYGGTPLLPLPEQRPDLVRVPAYPRPGYKGPKFYPPKTIYDPPLRDITVPIILPLVAPWGGAEELGGAALEAGTAALERLFGQAIGRLAPVH